MALTIDYSKTNIDPTNNDAYLLLDALTWATVLIGINEITAENADEFFARVSFHERVLGTFRKRYNETDMEDFYLTADEVRLGIGLSTNAARLTKSQFIKGVWETHERRTARTLYNAATS